MPWSFCAGTLPQALRDGSGATKTNLQVSFCFSTTTCLQSFRTRRLSRISFLPVLSWSLSLKQLNRYLDAVWVSTQRAMMKASAALNSWSFHRPPPELWDIKRASRPLGNEVLIAYHATSVHYSEHRFLQPTTIATVLQKQPNARFESLLTSARGRFGIRWIGMRCVVGLLG